MKVVNALAALAAIATATQEPLAVFDNSDQVSRIPTSRESAVMGRRILGRSKLATLATVYPDGSGSSRMPPGMEGVPVSLMDYIADCEDDGNPTILAIKIGTSFRNARAGSNMTISLRWTPPYRPAKRISILSRLAAYVPFLSNGAEIPDTVPYSAANLPRFALFGALEPIEADSAQSADALASCYVKTHPDAKYWLPGNAIHESEWVRFVVSSIYWVGGFGDRAYLGWIPVEEWKSVTRDEWEAIRLPGETKGWDEWHIGQQAEL